MSTHKHFDAICCGVLAFVLILTLFFVNAEHFDIKKAYSAPEYESRLFDTSYVHTVDIVMDIGMNLQQTAKMKSITRVRS